jgi:LmeA-like phospholipid-binding
VSQAPRVPGLWWASVGVLAVLVGVNLATPAVCAALVAGPLRTFLDAAGVEVTVEAWPPPALWWGRIDRITMSARDVRAGEQRLERLSATLGAVQVDPLALYVERAFVVRAIGSGHARAMISEAALARILAGQKGVRISTLRLRPGRVFVRGAIRALGTEIAIAGTGRLILSGGGTIDLIVDRALVGATDPAAPKGELTTRIPAVVRIPPLPFGLRLTDVRVDEGQVVLDAGVGSS